MIFAVTYKIAGGGNGGFLDNYNSELVGFLFLALGLLTPFYTGPLAALFGVVITILAIFHLFVTLLQTDLVIKENGCSEAMSDLLWALTVSLFALAKLPKELVDKLAAMVAGIYSKVVQGAIAGASDACAGVR